MSLKPSASIAPLRKPFTISTIFWLSASYDFASDNPRKSAKVSYLFIFIE
jgi:hypothetical protein